MSAPTLIPFTRVQKWRMVALAKARFSIRGIAKILNLDCDPSTLGRICYVLRVADVHLRDERGALTPTGWHDSRRILAKTKPITEQKPRRTPKPVPKQPRSKKLRPGELRPGKLRTHKHRRPTRSRKRSRVRLLPASLKVA